jgi:YHS domain-containing protein
MTAYEKAFKLLGAEEMGKTVALCATIGFVYAEKDVFVCAIPVSSSDLIDTESKYKLDRNDTWYVYIASGNLKKAFDKIPELKYLAFERFDSRTRIYSFDRFRRLMWAKQ